jgi:hypothetical protein
MSSNNLVNYFFVVRQMSSNNLVNYRGFQTWNFLKFKTFYSLIFLFSYFYVSELNLNRLNFWKK